MVCPHSFAIRCSLPLCTCLPSPVCSAALTRACVQVQDFNPSRSRLCPTAHTRARCRVRCDAMRCDAFSTRLQGPLAPTFPLLRCDAMRCDRGDRGQTVASHMYCDATATDIKSIAVPSHWGHMLRMLPGTINRLVRQYVHSQKGPSPCDKCDGPYCGGGGGSWPIPSG